MRAARHASRERDGETTLSVTCALPASRWGSVALRHPMTGRDGRVRWVLFPVAKRVSETAAVGFVASRVVEGALIVVGVVSVLTLLTLLTLRTDAPAPPAPTRPRW